MFHFGICSALTGFTVGAAMPFCYAIWTFQQLGARAAELPPGTAQCGMPGIFALALLFVGCPVGGAIGAALGFVGGAIYGYTLSLTDPN